MVEKINKKFIIFVIFLSLLSVFPLLQRGLPPTHDGEYHIIRFYEFNKTLTDGDLYPRWAPDLNNGFGVPLFNYVYPLPNYAASIFHLFGASFIDSFKLSMFLATLIGALFMFMWTRTFWGNMGGLVSSVFYSFSPYHSLDTYVRGSVGEVWALGLFPLFLWSATKFAKEKNYKFAVLTSVSIAFIIMSHNILGLMFFIFGVFYILFLALKSKDKTPLFVSLVLLVLGLGLSSIFWLPAILEREYVRGLEVFDFSNHFPELYQLLIPSWGSGFSATSLQNQLSFQIGITNLLALVLGFIVYVKIRRNKELSRTILFFLISFFAVFLLMLKISTPIWEMIPFMNYFQFPWRFLSLVIVITSFIAGSSIYLFKGKIAILILAFAIALGIGYAKPAHYFLRDDNYYTTRSNFIDGTNSPGNAFNTKWFDSTLLKTQNKLTLLKGEGSVQPKEIKATDYKFYLQMKEEGEILVNTAYFPGWSVSTDGKQIPIKITEDGRFSFIVPKGERNVRVRLENTNMQKTAGVILLGSILSILLLSKLPLFATIKR